jgi:hypothetical protein
MSGEPVKPPAFRNQPAAVGFVTQALPVIKERGRSILLILNNFPLLLSLSSL